MGYYRESDFLKKLGEKIKTCRVEQNFSQEQLAFECELSRSQISRFERGILNIGISSLYKIAKVLDIPLKDLLDI